MKEKKNKTKEKNRNEGIHATMYKRKTYINAKIYSHQKGNLSR